MSMQPHGMSGRQTGADAARVFSNHYMLVETARYTERQAGIVC